MNLQGSSTNLQVGGNVQPGTSVPNTIGLDPTKYTDPEPNSTPTSTSVSTQLDPAIAAAAAQAAADAARAASLRGDISGIISQIKDVFNSRYGQVDSLAGEQSGKLNERYGNESQDITRQIEGENQKIGAAHAASGTYDSSYRGNNVDTVTKAGESQIRDLGQELQDNVAKIAAWVSQQKTGFDASKSGYDAVMAHLAEEKDPGRLADLRATIESKLADERGKGADYNTAGQNAQALAAIAPSSTRAVQLKTTLSQIISGNADPSQKSAIGQSLITNSGLDPNDQQQLLLAFHSDLDKTAQTTEQPTA